MTRGQQRRVKMKKLTVLTVAVAAGLTTFAANAHEHQSAQSLQENAAKAATDAGKAKAQEIKAEADTDELKEDLKADAKKDEGSSMTLRTDESATLGYAAAVEERGTLADFFNRASEATPEATKQEEAEAPAETPQAQAAKSPQQGPYTSIIDKYAAMHGVPVGLARADVGVESNFRADARGSAGEVGLMQIKPATARAMGYSGSTKALYDPDTNIRFGMKYLGQAHQLAGGDLCGTILRYNAGHGATRMNNISAAYCAKVKSKLGSS